MRIAFASTPVGALGSGVGGGVELTLHSLATGLTGLGHAVEVFAPAGSVLNSSSEYRIIIHQIDGALQTPAQDVDRRSSNAEIKGSVLANIWERIIEQQDRFDVVLNFAYDELPMRLTDLLRAPVVHLVSMASLTDAMDDVIVRTSLKNAVAVAMHSHAQAATFLGLSQSVRIVGSGIEIEKYVFNENQNGPLGFVARISPEKGFDDAVAVAARTNLPLNVWGLMQDEEYFKQALERHPEAVVNYEGFVSSNELARVLGSCRAVLVTSKWVEAFGNVVIESLACGVPVVAYRRGGPAEIVRNGQTGFVVDPDDIEQIVGAVNRIGEISRAECRDSALENFSVQAFTRRVENWLVDRVAQMRQ